MIADFLPSPTDAYQWHLSLIAFFAIRILMRLSNEASVLVPAFREVIRINDAVKVEKVKNPRYMEVLKRVGKWSPLNNIIFFGLFIPFCISLQPQPLWQMLLDMFMILMLYDFIYYMGHRFLFHDEGFFGGPLIWVHAVHHRQHNPARVDTPYLHPLEATIGTGFYVLATCILAATMHRFHLVTIVVTWVIFVQINQHNHNRWENDRFPFRYLNHVARMHHNHHARFTGGNFGTISLFYDWLFGTLDYGGEDGRKKNRQVAAAK